ncbi:MAG: hypothetical protein HYR90_04815 [Candidatus Andersenbacteria bacterium]|nr:hypothetical protein [Candidatus Andersenbacteria bacterium]
MKQIEKDLRHTLRKEGYKGKKLEEELELRLSGTPSVSIVPPLIAVKVKKAKAKPKTKKKN